MDAGPVWAHRPFAMRLAPKSSLYRREVTEAALAALTEALQGFARGERPVPVGDLGAHARGRARPVCRQADRAIDWAKDDTATVIRMIHSADGFPGLRDEICGHPVRLFGAHAEGTLRGPAARTVIATCEELVDDEELRRQHERNRIPPSAVHAVVHAPWGSHPHSVHNCYDYDPEHLALYTKASKTDETFREYLDRFVGAKANRFILV